MTRVEQIWEELEARAELPVYKRVDELHPFDFYAGVEVDNSRSVLLISDFQLPLLEGRLRSIDIGCHLRQDGRWSTILRLVSPQLVKIFSAFCQDLLDSAKTCTSEQQMAMFVAERVERWETLFARARRGLLDQELRGLVGELLFLETIVCPTLNPIAAAASWHGPLDADQDFHFADRLVEVKTVGLSSLRVHISSAEQLDIPNGDLYVSVAVVEESGLGTSGALSVSSIVASLNEHFAVSTEAAAMFSERLALTGYVPGREHDGRCFKLHRFRHFRVQSSFPAIRRASLPAAITKVSYELDLTQCLDAEVGAVL